MVKFKLPVILAARSGLGTINHTLLTLAALHAAELPVHGVVLIGDQNRENRDTIEKFGHVRVIGEIPKLPNLHRTALMQVFLNHFDRSAFCAMKSPLAIWHPFTNGALDPAPFSCPAGRRCVSVHGGRAQNHRRDFFVVGESARPRQSAHRRGDRGAGARSWNT